MPPGLARPAAAFAALGCFWGGWAALLPEVARDLALSDRELGLALASAMSGALPAMWLAGRGGNQRGVPLLAPTVLALALTVLLPSFAAGAWSLCAALFFVGAASGALDVLMNAAVGELEAGDGRRRMHVAHAIFSAGLLAASVCAGLLRQAGFGFRPILVVVAAAALILSMAARGGRAPARLPQAPPGRRALPPDGDLIRLGLLCAVAFVIENGMEMWSALYLQRSLHAEPAAAALGPGVLGLSAVGGRLGAQLIARRLGDARLLALAGGLAATGVALFVLAPSWQLALPALILSGSGISAAAPTFFGLAGSWAAPGQRGSAVSLVTLISYLGLLAGPPALGLLSNALGLRTAIALLVVCPVCLGTLGPWLVRRHGRHPVMAQSGQVPADLL